MVDPDKLSAGAPGTTPENVQEKAKIRLMYECEKFRRFKE